jgi:hypothetical protein
MYLHSACHKDTGDFCRGVLCNPEVLPRICFFLSSRVKRYGTTAGEPMRSRRWKVVTVLADHCIIWAGDVSHPNAYRLSVQLGVRGYPSLAMILCMKATAPDPLATLLAPPRPEVEMDPRVRALLQPHGASDVRSRHPLLYAVVQLGGRREGVMAAIRAELARIEQAESISLTVPRPPSHDISAALWLADVRGCGAGSAARAGGACHEPRDARGAGLGVRASARCGRGVRLAEMPHHTLSRTLCWLTCRGA